MADLLVNFLRALDSWRFALSVGGIHLDALVSHLSGLSPQRFLGPLFVTMVEFPMVDLVGLVSMLLRPNLSVLDRLHHASVVILIDLFIDGGADFFVLCRLDRLVLSRWGGLFVNSGIVMPGFGREVANCFLGFFHCEGFLKRHRRDVVKFCKNVVIKVQTYSCTE